jgi:pimeloyl-ACP methyl ester carboxylesterase
MHESGKDKMELDRRRDGQQWALDYVIAKTGREQNFENPGRRFPETVKSYRMIPRVLFKEADHLETLARGAEDAGHAHTARRLYFKAVQTYRHAHHSIFTDDHPEKLFLYGRMTDCFERIIALSDGRLERVEVPWEDATLSGVFHRAPGSDPKPTVMFFPGMDMSKEAFPDPDDNPFAQRGIHVLSIDGPGQGVSNLRKVHVTEDNYERAAGVFFEHLLEREDVDASKVAVSGFSMGSFWGMRFAALEPRLAAVATAGACYGGKREIFNVSSPRFKQIFMYMAGLTDTVEVYNAVTAPKELWVLENEFHFPLESSSPNLGQRPVFDFIADWLIDAFASRYAEGYAREVLLEQNSGAGPYAATSRGFFLPERAGYRPTRP